MESIGLTCKKKHVLGLFIREQKIHVSRGVAVRELVEICIGDISAVLTATDLRFLKL
jgi:hypothetical protein